MHISLTQSTLNELNVLSECHTNMKLYTYHASLIKMSLVFKKHL